MLNIALIGTGIISDSHIQGWKNIDDADLKVLVDLDRKRAEEKAGKYKIGSTETDYKKVLGDENIDIIDICLPHHLHASFIIESLRAGKHVICEKPVALTLEEARRVIEEEKKHDKILMIAENWYYIPVISEALERYKRGDIGEIFNIKANLEFPGLRSWPKEKTNVRGEGWRGDKTHSGGGILMDAGIHSFSVARLFMGEAETVWGIKGKQLNRESAGLEDTFTAVMKFKNKALASFHFAEFSGYKAPTFDFAFMGEKGVIEADIITQNLTIHDETDVHKINKPAKGGMTEEIEHFVECIKENRRPLSDSHDQYRSLDLLLSAYDSASRGGVPAKIKEIGF